MRLLLWLGLFSIIGLSLGASREAERRLAKELAKQRREGSMAARAKPKRKKKRPSMAILAHAAFAPPSLQSMEIQRKAESLQKVSEEFDIADEEELLAGAPPPPRPSGRRNRLGGGAAGMSASFAETADIDMFFSRRQVLPGAPCLRTTVKCDLSTKYRSIDGRCNNLKHPEFGSASSTYQRLLPPAYDDEIGKPRMMGESKTVLPSSRSVSLKIHKTKAAMDREHSHMVMQWGQFLSHDITLTPQARAFSGGGWSGQVRALDVEDCSVCPGGGRLRASDDEIEPASLIARRRPPICPMPIGRRRKRDVTRGRSFRGCFPPPRPGPDPELCFPIKVPSGDPVFEKDTCMHFVRSAPGQLSLGARQQLNQITSFIDASNVYGSDPVTADSLRAKKNGLLLTSSGKAKGMLPMKDEPACARHAVSKGEKCFRAGDVRCNVQPGLMSMHTLWMNHHNRIAAGLQKVNPHWEDDEKYYQEARRIVIAQHQHITYNEYLPQVVGPDFVKRYSLKAKKKGRYYDYNGDCDATIYNEFAAAAFRFGHSLVDSTFNRAGKGAMNLTGNFMNPSVVHGSSPLSNVQSILEGMLKQPAQKADRFVTRAMRDELFGSEEEMGMDIVALNIQRGRDHGLQPYYKYREVFGLKKADTWEKMEKVLNKRTVAEFKKTFESAKDVDLYSGMLAEPRLKDALVGELCAHILSSQFHRLRDCDRFYYENGREQGSFMSKQLTSIRKTSLAKVMCDNVDKQSEISANAFELKSRSQLNCEPDAELQSVDLKAWKERPKTSRRKGKPRKKEAELRMRARCIPEIPDHPDFHVAT